MKIGNMTYQTLKTYGIRLLVVLGILAAFVAGWKLSGMLGPPEAEHEHLPAGEEAAVEEWTCSMHPQIRQPNPGQCPICGMDLIPVVSNSSGAGSSPRELKLSPAAARLAEISVTPAERRTVTKDIRLTGRIAWDERRFSAVTAWFPGRIDRLHVEVTGEAIVSGDSIADIYSPELRTAIDELILAKQRLAHSGRTSSRDSRQASRTIDAVREKLRLLGLTAAQIDHFEDMERPGDRITLTSDAAGIVTERAVVEGEYVSTGGKLLTVVDPDTVWVFLDVYEKDLAWIRTGQTATLTVEAFPGEEFEGAVAFIDPVLEDRTRTVEIRIDVPNPGGRLRPNMFVRAAIHAEPPDDLSGRPLVIPDTAPLVTGKRAVVYVADPDREGVYTGRDIVLGHLVGGSYIVHEGLSEGDLVVTNGAFKIDSAIQILAGPSMMNPGEAVMHDHGSMQGVQIENRLPGDISGETIGAPGTAYDVPETFLAQMDSVYAAYYRVQYALSHDSLEDAVSNAHDVMRALEGVDMALLDNDPHVAWMQKLGTMRSSLEAITAADGIETARAAFKPLSDALIATAKMFGTSGNIPVYRFHCPMAFDNAGSDWLQGTDDLENPWFGSSMFKCGTLEETISGGADHTHEND